MKFPHKLIDRVAVARLTILAIVLTSILIFGWSLMVAIVKHYLH